MNRVLRGVLGRLIDQQRHIGEVISNEIRIVRQGRAIFAGHEITPHLKVTRLEIRHFAPKLPAVRFHERQIVAVGHARPVIVIARPIGRMPVVVGLALHNLLVPTDRVEAPSL